MEQVTKKDNIFRVLDQCGPFATEEVSPRLSHFSPYSRLLTRRLRGSRMTTRYRIVRDQIFEFLNVNSFGDIQHLIQDKESRSATSQRAYELLGKMFALEGTPQEFAAIIANYSRTADSVIRYMQQSVLAPYASYFEMNSKVDTINNPVELLLIPFDDRYHKKARFEAKRKLVLMSLTAAIEQRERETEIEQKFGRFLDFLNAYVWSQEAKIGEREPSFLLSRHSAEDFSCSEVAVFPWEQAAALPAEPRTKRTLVNRLWFYWDKNKIPIYVMVRKKEPVAKILKLLRKGEENPDIAVADELGLMGVLDSIREVRVFQRYLVESATRAGSFLTLEDVSDTLENGTLVEGNTGSCTKTPMLKFFARMGGMRVEFIIHTNKSFLNYTYQRDVAHNEYEVRRLFDSGVINLLFPQDIYLIDAATIRDDLLRRFRRQIEEVE
ncbi:hypothetical protein [Desulfogranum mediterraneum]|uniref:hypothetical protein n=1 Tax=Desulfogranum mediterraneum TaxID=160661 RepID=UPI000424DC47|nr:hypothetical protein [Desulfogranum mediterraneum]